MQGLMNITRTQVPKLLAHAARTTTTAAPLLTATSVASRNYAGSIHKQSNGQETAPQPFEPIRTTNDAKFDDVWRPANLNSLKELESGDLNLSDSGVLNMSIDMEALRETRKATEHWRDEAKEYSEETAKQANLGTGFAQTASTFTTSSLKDSAAEMASTLGSIAKEKIGEVEEKLGWVQKKASEDTRKQEQKISNAADYVTEKVAEVKDEIAKSTSEWTADAKHKVDEAVHPTHLKDYAAKASEVMKEKAAEVYEKVAGTVHRAKDSLTGEHNATNIKNSEHYINTERDLHVDKEMTEEWSPEKPHEFEVPKQKEIR